MRVLAIDLGSKNIGTAVSDALGMTVRPVETIRRSADERDISRLKFLVEDLEAEAVVVGLPLRMDGTVGDAAAAAMRFVEKLRARLDVAVYMQDERLTSYEAEQMMIERGFAKSKRLARSDEFAAMIILQDYLSACERRELIQLEALRKPFSDMMLARRRPFRILVKLFVIVILAGGALALWVRKTVTTPVEHQSVDRIVTVDPGSGTQTIIGRLGEAGVVAHPLALRIYLRITGQGGNLKAGDYRFPSPISPLQAVEKIRRGDVDLERVTIPEGFNRFDIAETLAAKTGKATTEEFLRLMEYQTPIAQIAPTARNLEGYLFPDTYNYNSKTTPADLIQLMVNRFEEVFSPDWSVRASQLGLTVHQVVTLASIIEKEAKVPDERPHMASVFFNRLKRGMPLGSDPTFIYAAILAGDYDGNPNQLRYRDRYSPYNTYLISGLPPGPIASPGRASLEAVLNPGSTDDLYFVVNGTGGRHKFSRTAAEHEAAVEEYRRQQRELQQRSGGR